MNRLKILQVFSRYLQYGGEEGSVFRIGDAMLSDFDVEYFLASSEELLTGSRLMVPFKTWNNIPVANRLRAYQKIGRFDFWQIHNVFPAISPAAYRLAEELEVPIIHFLHNYRMGCVNATFYRNGADCTLCAGGNFMPGVIHGCWRGSRAQSGMLAILLTSLRRMGLFQKVHRWIAISRSQRTAHIEMGIPEDRIDVVEHFYDQYLEDISPLPQTGYALFMGRLVEEKGVDRLLKAWAMAQNPEKLIIAGEGPESSKLKQLAADLQLDESRVEFVGFVKKEQQQQLWAGSSYSVIPSVWREPFGMVALESWSYGRPVVAHRIGALGDIVSDGVDGFLAEVDQVESLAAALNRASQSKSELPEMGRAGYGLLSTRYGKDRWLQDIKKVYAKANQS